jgi:hypothetical protein
LSSDRFRGRSIGSRATRGLDDHEAINTQVRRRVAAGLLLVVAAWFTVTLLIDDVAVAHQIGVWARVRSKSCHVLGGGGGDSVRPWSDLACALHLSYQAPNGKRGAVTFGGVNASRLHRDAAGHEVVRIYFAPGSSAAVSPQDRPPLWLVLSVLGAAWLFAGGAAWALLVGSPRGKYVNRRAREARAASSERRAPSTTASQR